MTKDCVVETDLGPLRECRIEHIALSPLTRDGINRLADDPGFAPLAVAGIPFSCTAMIRHRLPFQELRLSVDGTLSGQVCPVASVVFPEQGTLIPDIVGEPEPVSVGGNTAAMFLLKLDLPDDTPPGKYAVTVHAEAASHEPACRTFTLHVLPPVKTAANEHKVVFWPHWETFCRYLKLELWSEEFWTAAECCLREMAAGGMNVIMASICHDPFRYPLPPEYHAFNHYPTMIRWMKDSGGRWHFDYSVYDRYVELNMRLGIDREIECHSLLPCKCQGPVLCFYDADGRLVQQPTSCGSPEYQEAWTAFLADFIAHNRSRGWADKLTLCPYDEPQDPASFRQVARLAKSIAPEIRISAAITAQKALEMVDVIDIATVHLSSGYDADGLDKLRKAGVEVRWYNCCAPDWGNVLFASELSDAYRLAWMTEAGEFAGFLRWSIIDWPELVLSNPGFNWPTGDTHLLYPGPRGPLESLRWHAYKQGRLDLALLLYLGDDALLKYFGACSPVEWNCAPGEIQQCLYQAYRQHLLETAEKTALTAGTPRVAHKKPQETYS